MNFVKSCNKTSYGSSGDSNPIHDPGFGSRDGGDACHGHDFGAVPAGCGQVSLILVMSPVLGF